MLALILARGLQGLGGGGLISLAQTIVADVVAPRSAAATRAISPRCSSTSSVAGPVLGGFIAEHLHWSLIFWINLPLGLVALLDDRPRAAPAAAPRAAAPARPLGARC